MKIIKKYKYIFLLGFLFFILRFPSLFEPYWYGDEGIYLVLGQAIRKGLTLYSQIHDNKPPTLYYLAAIGRTVFGFRLLLFVWMIPTVYYFYKLSQKYLTQFLSQLVTVLFVIISSIPLIEGNIANAEIFMLLPTILAVYLFIETKKPIYQLLIGLLLGFAFTIKVPVAIELVFLCYWLIISNFNISKIKKIITGELLIIAGFTIPIIVQAIYYATKGALNSYLYAALFQNIGYLSSWSTGNHTAPATQGGLTTRLLYLIIFYLIIGALYLFKKINSHLTFLILWFAAALFGVLLSARPYPHYLIQLIPSSCLLIGYFFANNKISNKIIILAGFAFLAFVLSKYKFYFYSVGKYYSYSYKYIFKSINKDEYYSSFGWHVSSVYKISNYITANTNTDEKIFIWDDSPFIYALSNRLPVGRYTVAYHIVDFNRYQETIDQLKIQMPKIIVYRHMDDRPFPELDNLISRYYYPDTQIDSSVIYRLRQ